jgi:ketosteroid isomerase-like protein
LEKVWNRALEEKDTKALDMLLANTMVSVDMDGSIQSKGEFLASIKAPDYLPSQAVTEQSTVQVYGDAAVVVGILRVKGTDKGKSFLHRKRFVDTWINTSGAWQCVATTSNLITSKQSTD